MSVIIYLIENIKIFISIIIRKINQKNKYYFIEKVILYNEVSNG